MALDTNGWTPPALKQAQKTGMVRVSFNEATFDYTYNVAMTTTVYAISELVLQIIFPNGKKENYRALITKNETEDRYINTFAEINLDQEGEYLFEYTLKWRSTYSPGSTTLHTITAMGYIAVGSSEKFQPYTISGVMDRLLSVTPLRLKDGTNKYEFMDSEAFSTEEAPEFSFTDNTLFEAILQVAQYKQRFPFLYKNQIYFRPLWNGETMEESQLPPATRILRSSSIDQYCTALDSTVENMVCINDTNVGTVIEPYAGGYISTRSAAGSEISETTAMIPTQSAIYQAVSLLMGEVNGAEIGDLIAYLYEQGDYDALSDTSSAYPNSKGYALKYTRMNPNYTELAHRINTQNNLTNALTRPALANIVRAKKGGDVGNTLLTYISDLLGKYINNKLQFKNGYSFADLLFQPTYIPVVNARVKQYKEYTDDFHHDSTICYNQTAELVDSEAFGEHVKGMIEKLGNHTEIRVCEFAKIDDVPKVGTIVNIDGEPMSVYDTAMTIYETHVVVTLCLVKYAELSQYIGVKNKIKDSDISKDKCYNRFVNFEEFLIFSHEDKEGTGVSFSADALNQILTFDHASPLTCVEGTGYTEDGVEISTVLRPVKHLALGNSIYFQWEYENNFAAGYQSNEAPDGATSVLTGTLYNRAQKAVRYGDMYGRMETYGFKLLKHGPKAEECRWEIPSTEFTAAVNGDSVTISAPKNIPAVSVSIMYIDKRGTLSSLASMIEKNSSITLSGVREIQSFTATIMHNAEGEDYIRHKIGHSYPLCPEEVRGQAWERSPVFSVSDLVIKKNSAERLIFAAQYHFRREIKNFIIGAGMSNFSSLIGGEAKEVRLYSFLNRINRNERHIPKTQLGIRQTLPTVTIEADKKRAKIVLPAAVNNLLYYAWALVGIDRNGNEQVIYGENRHLGETFNTTLYLRTEKTVSGIPAGEKKYKLTYGGAGESNVVTNGIWFYINGDTSMSDVAGTSGELPAGTSVTFRNGSGKNGYLHLNAKLIAMGTYDSAMGGGEYTFTLDEDTTYYFTAESGGGGTDV